MKTFFAMVAAMLAASLAYAEVWLAGVFCDHMVLPQDSPVPVLGWAEPGEGVTVEFKGQQKNAIASADGPPLEAECTCQVTTPDVAGSFNAVAYLFGRSLRQKLGVPVGVIASGYGGSRIEAWMSCGTLSTTEWDRETIDIWRGIVEPGGRMHDRDVIEPVPDIHLLEKAPIGERLALQAMNLAYGDAKTVAGGPLYRKATFADGKAALAFDHVGGGLEAKGGPLREFTIAGADGKCVPTDATIQGDRVIAHSPTAAEPVAVRYGWANDPHCNLVKRDTHNCRDDGRSWNFSVTDLTNPNRLNPTSGWDRAYHGPIGSGMAICE